jgi:hypothetical protein
MKENVILLTEINDLRKEVKVLKQQARKQGIQTMGSTMKSQNSSSKENNQCIKAEGLKTKN